MSVKRAQIVEAAYSLLGVKFRHQGRDKRTGLDCVGFAVAIGKEIDYPFEVFDKATYKRLPSEELALEYLRKNLDEISIDEVQIGDMVSMISGDREVHVAVIVDEKRMIHARRRGFTNGAVEIDYIRKWRHLFKRGFRVRGLVD